MKSLARLLASALLIALGVILAIGPSSAQVVDPYTGSSMPTVTTVTTAPGATTTTAGANATTTTAGANGTTTTADPNATTTTADPNATTTTTSGTGTGSGTGSGTGTGAGSGTGVAGTGDENVRGNGFARTGISLLPWLLAALASMGIGRRLVKASRRPRRKGPRNPLTSDA